MPVRGATPVVAPEENPVISETMVRAGTPRFTMLVVVLAGIAGCLRSDRVRSTGAVTFDDFDERFGLKRFEQELAGAAFDGIHRGGDVGVGGHQDKGHVGHLTPHRA
jgi:hypothetical protein